MKRSSTHYNKAWTKQLNLRILIDQCQNAKPCPLIVKFTRYNTRNRICRNKKKLKGTGISVADSLAAERVITSERARQEHTFNNVWSQDGKIMFFDKNTKLKFIIVNFFFGDESDQLWRKKMC